MNARDAVRGGSSPLARLAEVVGGRYAIADPAAMGPYLDEPRRLFHGRAALVLRPGSPEEVARLLAIASETRTAVVPQGGNTGLVGGQVPDADGHQVILSLDRLDRIRDVDAADNTIVAEAGVRLQRVQEAADAAGRYFPLSLASEGSCTIGGNLAVNAGGTGVLAYGRARELCLGLEVALADGRLWHGLKRLRKDNTGYDLRDVFIGSEGTLGIITAAVLKIFPAPRSRATAWAAVPDPQASLDLLAIARDLSGGQVTAIELIARIGIDFVVRHGGIRDPLATVAPWYVLIELSGQGDQAGLDAVMQQILERAFETGIVTDATIAASAAQAAAIWAIRETLPEAQRPEGASIKHDTAVPVSKLPQFLAEATEVVTRLIPGSRPCPFGHVGDGNVHFNITQPEGMDGQAFLDRWEEVAAAVHAIALKLGGTISAEHGIGRLKRHLLPGIKEPVELDLMAGIKRLFDPHGILNPGKLLPDRP